MDVLVDPALPLGDLILDRVHQVPVGVSPTLYSISAAVE
jgi:hypothetical protein